MPLPEDVRLRALFLLLAFCQLRVPATLQRTYRLSVRIRMNAVTLYECYGPWQPRFPKSSRTPVAQFRYDLAEEKWTLYWSDYDWRWHHYDRAEPTPDIARLIAEVHEDPMGLFFSEKPQR